MGGEDAVSRNQPRKRKRKLGSRFHRSRDAASKACVGRRHLSFSVRDSRICHVCFPGPRLDRAGPLFDGTSPSPRLAIDSPTRHAFPGTAPASHPVHHPAPASRLPSRLLFYCTSRLKRCSFARVAFILPLGLLLFLSLAYRAIRGFFVLSPAYLSPSSPCSACLPPASSISDLPTCFRVVAFLRSDALSARLGVAFNPLFPTCIQTRCASAASALLRMRCAFAHPLAALLAFFVLECGVTFPRFFPVLSSFFASHVSSRPLPSLPHLSSMGSSHLATCSL